MIEIALCDDSPNDIEAILAYAERFAEEHKDNPIQLSPFTSAKKLLRHIENHGGFDMYLLDVMMSEMSGIQLAETIRSRGEHAEIVFLTVSPDYALDAFSVYASGYLIKPPNRENFDKTLLHAIRSLMREKKDVLAVKTKDGLLRIPLHKIVMIESFNHSREITLTDGSAIETPSTLVELFKQLEDHKSFYMPHRAYIANLDNSVGVVRYDLLMLGSRRIPIPKNQFVQVRDVVQNYFFKRKNI